MMNNLLRRCTQRLYVTNRSLNYMFPIVGVVIVWGFSGLKARYNPAQRIALGMEINGII
jgi:hypothetical protein